MFYRGNKICPDKTRVQMFYFLIKKGAYLNDVFKTLFILGVSKYRKLHAPERVQCYRFLGKMR